MTPATARGLVRRVGPDPDPPADADLVGRFARAADPAAFAALVRRHGPMVLAACRRMLPDPADADDAFQAVFLVLVRKAGAVRPPGAVGGWLHGVAVRTAQKARVAAARRRRREMNSVPVAPPNPGAYAPGSPEHAELRAVLDEELARLPEALRTAVVLCDLGGRTRAEAAADLGCPEGTVAARLHRARRLLADRLARRGVTAPAGLAVAAAAVPGDLFAAVAGFAAGGPVPPAVRALAEGVVRSMVANPLSLAFAAVAAVVLAAGAGVLWAAGAPSPEGTTPVPDTGPPPELKVGSVYAVGYSPDGSWLVHVGGGKATVRDAATRAERFAVDAEFANFSGDGTKLYVFAGDRFRTLDATAGKELAVVPDRGPRLPEPPRWEVASPDGAMRVRCDGYSHSYTAHPGSGLPPPLLPGQFPPGDQDALTPRAARAGAFSPDGSRYAAVHAATPDGKAVGCVTVWTTAAPAARVGTVARGKAFWERAAAVAWAPDGTRLAVGFGDGTRVYDAATLRELRTVDTGPATAVAWSADGTRLAVATTADELAPGVAARVTAVRPAVGVFDAGTGLALRRLDGFADNLPVVALAFRPDGKELACGSGFLPGEEPRKDLPQPAPNAVGLRLVSLDGPPDARPGDPVADLSFDPDGTRYLVVGGGKVAVRDVATDRTLWVAPAEAARFTRTPAGRDDVATLTAEGVVLRGAVDGAPHGRTAPRPKAVGGWRAVRFAADGTRYAAHTGTGVLVFETTTGAEAADLAEQYGPGDRRAAAPKADVFFSPDGRKVVGVGVMVEPGNVGHAEWELEGGGRRRATGGDPRPTAAAYSPDNDTIAVGYADRIVLLSNKGEPPPPDAAGRERTTLRRHKQLPPAAPVTALAYSPDGKTVAAGVRGGAGNVAAAVQLLDAATGKELRRFGGFAADAAVTALAFAPDGTTLLAGTGTGEIKRFALADPPPDAPPANRVSDLSFAPDGKRYLVVTSGKATVKDAATDRVVWEAPGQAARFTPDGAAVLTIGKEVVRREAATGKALQSSPRGKTDFAWHVAAFSADGTRYVGHTGLHARLYDTATGFEPARLTPDPGTPGGAVFGGPGGEGVVFSPDGKLVAAVGIHVGNSQMGAAAWDTATGKRVFVTPDPAVAAFASGRLPIPPTAAAFAPDGKTLAVAFGKTVRLYETGRFAERAALPDTPGSGPVTALAFSPDGTQLAVGYRLPLFHGGEKPPRVVGHKTEVQLIELATTKELRRFDGFEGVSHMGPTRLPVTALAFSPDGKTLLAGTGLAPITVIEPKDAPPPPGSGEVRRFTLAVPPPDPAADPPAVWRPKGTLPFDDRVQSVAFSPDGKTLAVGGRGGPAQHTVAMWDAATLKKRWAGGPLPAGTTGVSFSPDGRLLAATRDKTTGLYDPRSGQPVLMNPPLPGGTVAAFSPDGKHLAVGDGKRTVVVPAAGGPVVLDATGPPEPPAAPQPGLVAWSPDGTRLVTPWCEAFGEGEFGADIFTLQTRRAKALIGHPGRVTAAAWSPDGKLVATGCGKGNVIVWDPDTRKELRRTRLTGRSGAGVVHALAFAPDGKTLAAAADLVDGKNVRRVALLDPATGERRGSDLQHFGELTPVSVAFSPDGATLAVGLADFLPPGQPPLEGAARLPGGVALFTTAPEPAAAPPAAAAPPPPAPVPPAAWREKASLPAFDGPVYSVAYSPDGKALAVGGAAGAKQHAGTMWDATTLKALWADPALPGPILPGPARAAFSPSGPLLALTHDKATDLYDVATGRPLPATLQRLPGGRAVAFGLPGPGVAGRPRYKLAVSDGRKTSVLTWFEGGPVTTAEFGPLKNAKADGTPPAGVAFSPSGEQLVFIPNAKIDPAWVAGKAAQKGEESHWFAQVWGGGSGRPMHVLPHGTSPVTAVAWCPTGKHVATACNTGDVVVWDGTTFKELRRTRIGGRGGSSTVFALAFAPDGKTLAAAVTYDEGRNAERVVMLDPTTGARLGTDIQGFASAAPVALAFAPDGKTLAVGCVTWEVVNTRVVGEHGLVKLYTTDP